MGFLGDTLSITINIANIPAGVVDKVVLQDDNQFASPLRELSKIVKKVDEE